MELEIKCTNCDGDEVVANDLCEDCGTTCERCDGFTAIDEFEPVLTNSETVQWCASCVTYNTTECTKCTDRLDDRSNWPTVEDDWLCEPCAENNTFSCEYCGDLTYSQFDYHCDTCGDCYCEGCYEEYHSHTGNLHFYSYKPSPVFHSTRNDQPGTHRYMGVELEIDNGDDRDAVVEELLIHSDGEDLFYLKEDGSLDDGVEIVTHPLTFDCHMTKFPWGDVLTVAKENGFKSHDAGTCGLHVHIDRRAFGKSLHKQEFNISKLIVLFWKHWDYIMKFSRRRESDLHWAEPNYTHDKFSKAGLDHSKNKGRYSAINTENYSTIELRIFRGSLKLETVRATLQLVDLLITIVTTKDMRWCFTSSWADIVELVRIAGRHKYGELADYLVERDICA